MRCFSPRPSFASCAVRRFTGLSGALGTPAPPPVRLPLPSRESVGGPAWSAAALSCALPRSMAERFRGKPTLKPATGGEPCAGGCGPHVSAAPPRPVTPGALVRGATSGPRTLPPRAAPGDALPSLTSWGRCGGEEGADAARSSSPDTETLRDATPSSPDAESPPRLRPAPPRSAAVSRAAARAGRGDLLAEDIEDAIEAENRDEIPCPGVSPAGAAGESVSSDRVVRPEQSVQTR